MSDKVIDIRNAEPISIRKQFFLRLCLHRQVVVCASDRTLVCEKCGCNVDPFQFLEYLAYRQETAETEFKNQLDLHNVLDGFIRSGGSLSISRSVVARRVFNKVKLSATKGIGGDTACGAIVEAIRRVNSKAKEAERFLKGRGA